MNNAGYMDGENGLDQDDNRREWLRITDNLLLEYWREGEDPSAGPTLSPQAADEAIKTFLTKPTTDLLAHIPGDEAEPVLAPWLMKIDWALELVLKAMARLQPGGFTVPRLTEVNLSAGGLGFPTTRLFRAGDILEIRLILPPFYPIRAQAQAIRLEPIAASPHEQALAAKFTRISLDDRERLIRHILSVQARHLRDREVNFY